MARLWKGLPNGQYQPLDGGPAITYVPIGPPPPPPTGPTAAFTSTQSQLSVSFNASTSTTDPSATITGYAWTFGDGASGTGKTPSHTYAAAGAYTVKLTVTDSNGATDSATHTVTVAGSPPPPPSGVWWPGLDRCGSGLNAPDATKKADTLARIQQIATAMGKTAAQVRAATMYHTYNAGITWGVPPMVQWANDQGFQGCMVNQKPDISTGANGGLDAQFTSYLKLLSALNMNICVVMQHEPENNGWSQAQATQWCQMTARFLNITYDHGDPNMIYSTCHIPASAGTPRTWWNVQPALRALVGNTKAQAIQDASFCGLDPYPGAEATLEKTCRAAITDFKSWGWTRFSMPEVGLFNWIGKNPGTPGGLTAAQQAQRLYDELWVWAKANGFECFNYFDFSSAGDARSQSRTIDTPEEQLQFGKILFNAA